MRRCEITKQQLFSSNSDANIRFDDLCDMLMNYGFRERIKGSHHIFVRDNMREIINLQPDGSGKAKKYQVRQVRAIMQNYAIGQ
jgi:predicted RNA binding protein YcfA (HicA-like mRNA interferase family)